MPQYFPLQNTPVFNPPKMSDFEKLRQNLGLEPSSPLDLATRVPEESIKFWQQSPKNFWDYLSKAPQEQAPAAAAAQPAIPPAQAPRPGLSFGGGQPAAPTPPVLGPNQFRLPSGFDPTKSVTGTASFGGPKLNNEAALSGLRSTQTGQGFRLPTEELYKQSFAEPGTTAPGSAQFMGGLLSERIGNEGFSRAMEQDQQRTLQGALVGTNPAMQAQANLEAQRKALPAQRQGMDAATIREGGAESQGLGNYYNELAKTLQGGGQGLGANVSGVSRSGITFRNPNAAINQAQLSQLTNMRRMVQQQGATEWTMRGQQPTEAARGLEQTLTNILGTFPASDDVKNSVRQILTDPEIERQWDSGEFEDDPEVANLLSILRGQL